MTGIQELFFDPDTHTYTLADGTILPSITEIVKPLGADFDDVDPYMEQTLEVAAERGTVCHAVLEALINGEEDIEYPAAYEAHIDAVRQFVGEHEIIPIAAEKPVCSPLRGVAGTPDLLCWFDGLLTLLDYKFVSQVAKSKVKAQLNGYNLIYNELGVFPEALKTVQFLPGTYRIYPTAIDPTEFDLCMEIHRHKNRKHPRGRIE